ncbi:hypothetical protein [uncultured Cocleimonas sp.]|uniref:hypothetical protein n=1 Tax=uncultured Cocleimonas sp. TaxID=1051587 RepID=UPI0026174D9D|nr:hypothetical protein [uncultured Cocleimonas sp.]
MNNNSEIKQKQLAEKDHDGFSIRSLFAGAFSFLFFVLSGLIAISMLVMVGESIIAGEEFMPVILKSINTGIIALAVFELALVINQEYRLDKGEHNVITSLRRTLPRFIGTVCVALSLEGLIMVIKYSQLDMAGNLYYPVAIIISTAILLASLGLFLKLLPEPTERKDEVKLVSVSSNNSLSRERARQKDSQLDRQIDRENADHPVPMYN